MTESIFTKNYKYFLTKLKKARLEANFTQFDVAKIIKKPQSFISKCESGERRVDIAELKIFAEIYKKKIDFFI